MFPDFPEAKKLGRRAVLRAVRQGFAIHEPLLEGIRHNTDHEGHRGRLERADDSVQDIEYQRASAELLLTREQMRRITMPELAEKVAGMSQQLAGQQVQLMLARVSEAVDEVGNSVSAASLGTKAAFLEMQRRIEVEFDPVTLEPKNMVIVLHPSQVESFKAQVDEWEKDPEFVKEMESIRAKQIEDWRARENRRTLVD